MKYVGFYYIHIFKDTGPSPIQPSKVNAVMPMEHLLDGGVSSHRHLFPYLRLCIAAATVQESCIGLGPQLLKLCK